MTRDLPPAIVFRGNDICFLGIIRSLAKSGIPHRSVIFTWPGAKTWWSEKSDFYNKDILISNPFTDPFLALDELIRAGKQLLSKWGQPLLAIPSSDTNLMFLLDNEEILSPYFTLMGDKKFTSYRNDVAHKYQCFKLLSESPLNLCPATFHCKKASDISDIIKKISYPAIFKPSTKDYGQSFYVNYKGLKAVECETQNDLCTGLNDCMRKGFDIIAQEKVLFDRVEDEIPFYAYVDRDHNIRMAATGIKELIQPYPFGTATILKLSWHPELLSIAQEVVRSLRWRGIIMIEFIRDKRDGCWKVIEINVRPWLFVGFYERFGLNYPAMLYRDWQFGLESYEDKIVCPSEKILSMSPIHIDLQRLYINFEEEQLEGVFNSGITGLSTWLKQFSFCITEAYFDPADQRAGLEPLKEIFIKVGLFPSAISDLSELFFDTSALKNPTALHSLENKIK